MGSPARTAAAVLLSLLGLFSGFPTLGAQELNERDALCNADGCYVVYFQRKTFLDSWRACKEKGGTLATIKRQEEADSVAALFSGVELRNSRASVRMWIGLQRQPRQCMASQPLRGFSWTTGDQDTQYTNWLKEDQPTTCSVPRCVVMTYSTTGHQQEDNFKWLDGACSLPVDGYVCRYTYKGMCPAVWNEGGGNALYATPFDLLSSLLTHVPYGSVATVPCPAGTRDEQSALCMLREDGTVGWSRDAPLCSDAPQATPGDWCGRDNGGCEHFCREAGAHFFCECSEGFQPAEDGRRCEIADECLNAPCEFECLPLPDGFRCACPEGYMLAADDHGCQDVDECLQSPCQQLCVNAPGTFECRCRHGYRLDADGECEDVDECAEEACEHACENTPGAHVCHCHLGFYPQPEDPRRCQDVDECQIPDTCEQMCVNYEGGFECYCEVGYELMADHFSCRKIGEDFAPTTTAYPWAADPVWDPREAYSWTTPQSHTDWPLEGEDTLDWLTDPPKGESDVIWVTRDPLDRRPLKPFDSTQKELDWTDLSGVAHPEWPATPSTAPTPSPTPPDWYKNEEEEEEEEEEETTTTLPIIPTTTTSEGAWNWFWVSPTPPSREQADTAQEEEEKPATEEPDDNSEVEGDGDDEQVTGTDSPQFMVKVVEVGGEENKDIYPEETTSLPDRLLDLQDSTPEGPYMELEGAEVKEPHPENEGQKQGGSTWLLVGLLVPLSIFVVVMVALGIVYCTRCTVQPRNKSATDCYHWISGAHDKQCAASPPEGVKSQV